MAREFDTFPVDDPVTRQGHYLSSLWRDALASFSETLSQFISQFGFFVPKMTESQRDAIQSPVEGQLIYVSDLGQLQVYKSTGWTLIV